MYVNLFRNKFGSRFHISQIILLKTSMKDLFEENYVHSFLYLLYTEGKYFVTNEYSGKIISLSKI